MNKYEAWPVVGPIITLLKSPALFAMIVTLLVNMFVSIRAEFEEVRLPLMAIVTALGTLLVSGQLVTRLAELKGVPFHQLPFFGPVALLLRSRKFWFGVGTLLASMIVAVVPEFESVREELIGTIALIGATMIGGIAWEDGQAKKYELLPAATLNTAVVSEASLELSNSDIDRLAGAVVSLMLSRGYVHDAGPKG